MAQMARGIDYGLGKTNIDTSNGIRYGVISQHTVDYWTEASEVDYGKPHCPKCGNEVESAEDDTDYDDTDYSKYRNRGCDDFVCHVCRHTLDSDYVTPDEPVGWTIDDGEYQAEDCLDSDIIIVKAPYYTYAPFCSPCVPGAGNLDSAEGTLTPNTFAKEFGVKTYCFGHDWFDGGKAPYRVFRVSDDTEVLPE